MTDQPAPARKAKAPIPMTPDLVTAVYALFNAKPPEDRLICKVVVTMEVGKSSRIEETCLPIEDVNVPDSSPPQMETKGNA